MKRLYFVHYQWTEGLRSGYGRCHVGRDNPVSSIDDIEMMEAAIQALHPSKSIAIVNWRLFEEAPQTTGEMCADIMANMERQKHRDEQ